ncbi:uncharacterized protein [Amphiura filiformis]|uniref:uncharacterized protein n=1 Tax=Amphiura filiformis TaxID=82378 RepID=UPI003B210E4D
MHLNPHETVFLVYDSLLFTFGVVGNTIVILTFGRKSVPKPPAVILVLVLALGDVLACVFASPLDAATIIYSTNLNFTNDSSLPVPPFNNLLCKSSLGTLFSTQYFTVILHGLIAINRYIAVSRPPARRMSRRVTLGLAVAIFALSLCIGISITFVSTFTNESTTDPCAILHRMLGFKILWLVSVLTVLLLIICSGILMVLSVRKQQNAVFEMHGVQRQQKEDSMVSSDKYTQSISASCPWGQPSSTTPQHHDDISVCIADSSRVFYNRHEDGNCQLQFGRATGASYHGKEPICYCSTVSLRGASADRATNLQPHGQHSLSVHARRHGRVSADTARPSTMVPPLRLIGNNGIDHVDSKIQSSPLPSSANYDATKSGPLHFTVEHSQENDNKLARNLPQNFHKRTLDRMSKILLFTIAIFALTWIPVFVILMIPQSVIQDRSEVNPRLIAFVIFMRDLPRFNHIINPVIYAFMSSKFRKEFMKLIRRD